LFQENGLTFAVDVVAGQKTGFFLDQRDNRARVEKLAAGKRVLNVFAYTGGFSLYAARGGATAVTSLDLSQPALETAVHQFPTQPPPARRGCGRT
jgi:23S rRNA (cytosine1962-C5)-methyltransferase